MEGDVRPTGYQSGPPPWEPGELGFRSGQLVEITTYDPAGAATGFGGQVGQLQRFIQSDSSFAVQVAQSGASVAVPAAALRTPGPEEVADGACGFDLLLGPRTQWAAFGEEVAACLADKGFCTIRRIGPAEELGDILQAVKIAEEAAYFGRLAPELERGHLGRGGRAKAMWLHADQWLDAELPGAYLLAELDMELTRLAEVVHPYCADILGREVTDRTPALLCLSMTDGSEIDYNAEDATDGELSEFFATWRRSALRVVHFLGPSEGAVTLRRQGAAGEGERIEALPNTVILSRTDKFDYQFEEPETGYTCWLQCFLMQPESAFVIDGPLDGLEFLQPDPDGPPPPTGTTVSTVALAIQAAGNMTDHLKEWAAYLAGVDGQLEIPKHRFDYEPYYSPEVDNPQRTTYVKHNGMQEDIEWFDNRIFEISSLEAAAMDPQCRQVLEVGCTILFQQGITKKMCNKQSIHASVSVGCDKEEWLNMPEAPQTVATNNQLAITANRFNYVFNFKGGSFVCDTACSSSLVATHLGKLALLERRWDPLEFHLAMGTNLTLTVRLMIGSCMSHMLSPGGRCFTFDASANGYNRGDGTAGMMLKVGDVAEERWAFLRGTQMGQDGRSASLSAPNGPAQEKCIWGALREAQMRPPDSTVWECHGTGTALGDPIEVGAVRRVQIKEPRHEPLLIATSKANIGHLEGSAAMVAMCKCVVTALHTRCPPTQHLRVLNAHLEHAKFEAVFCTEACCYKYDQGHCQVSSFGVGGTNGHAIFWGERSQDVDLERFLMRKIRGNPPAVIMDGRDPSSWEFDPLTYQEGAPGETHLVTLAKDPLTREISVRYTVGGGAEAPAFYCISSNLNQWTGDRMAQGDVHGLHYAVLEFPPSGELDFRFLADGDDARRLGPPWAACATRTAAILGPSADCETFWRLRGAAGDGVRVELLVSGRGAPTLSWFVE